MSTIGLFNEFDVVSKEEWLRKATSDRKGATLEELNWDFDGISISPFFHSEDLPNSISPINSHKTDNAWQIGERISGGSVESQNSAILNALENGTSALHVTLRSAEQNELEKLFADVQHEWISTHLFLDGSVDGILALETLAKVIENKNQNSSIIQGSITIAENDKASWDIVKKLVTIFPEFKLEFRWNEVDPKDINDLLLSLLERTYSFLQRGQESGVELSILMSLLQFSVCVSDNYYKNIILLRSLRRLIRHLCSTYNSNCNSTIRIATWLDEADQTDDKNYNLIKNTSQILGAVIGGADIIYPMTFTAQTSSEGHDQRISRNINHVLQSESYMDRVVDPAAGSYFFESMTDSVCNKVWEEFQKRVE